METRIPFPKTAAHLARVASTDETRGAMTHLEVSTEGTISATDGFRLVRMHGTDCKPPQNVYLRAGVLKKNAAAIGKSTVDAVELSNGQPGRFQLRIEGAKGATATLTVPGGEGSENRPREFHYPNPDGDPRTSSGCGGSFPNVQAVIPNGEKIRATVGVNLCLLRDTLDAMTRAAGGGNPKGICNAYMHLQGPKDPILLEVPAEEEVPHLSALLMPVRMPDPAPEGLTWIPKD